MVIRYLLAMLLVCLLLVVDGVATLDMMIFFHGERESFCFVSI